jgi:holo-[acyl-carrier protein] synthase
VSKILGIGLDIVEIPRLRQAVEKRGRVFLNKVFTKRELKDCRGKKKGQWASLAGRWAAKEAVYKAVGGFWKGPAPHNQVEIYAGPSGQPLVRLLPGIKKSLAKCSIQNIQISISHEREIAAAVAILIGE